MKEVQLTEIELHEDTVSRALSTIFNTIVFLRSYNSDVEDRLECLLDITHAVDPSLSHVLDKQIDVLMKDCFDKSLVQIGPYLGKTTVILELRTYSTKSWFLPSTENTVERWLLPIIVNKQPPNSVAEGHFKALPKIAPQNFIFADGRDQLEVNSKLGTSQEQLFKMRDLEVSEIAHARLFMQERSLVLQCLSSILELVNDSQEHMAAASSTLQFSISCGRTRESLGSSFSKLLRLPPGVSEC